MTQKVVVLIGDVVGSRKIHERDAFDNILSETLDILNCQNPHILSPYTITIGDEIQAVFSRADDLLSDVISIMAAIHPQKMRFSFGIGTLINPVNPIRAIGMDGPAFHDARDGIMALKKTTNLLAIDGVDIPRIHLLRQMLFLISHRMRKWHKTRFQVMAMLQRGTPVKEIAALLDVSDQAVYKNIQTGALEVINELFIEIEAILNEYLDSEK
ncbi:MAG: SatD family protein [Anaerolineaceae bacterium]|nr:SatD family protein [Anaerolineaceae bacterium]